MNLLKKCKTVFFVLMGVTVALVSCKPQEDVDGTIMSIADKNIPDTYSYTEVDSTALTATVYEYVLNKVNASGVKTGKYQISVFDGLNGSVGLTEEREFTWTRGEFIEAGKFIQLFITYADGAEETVKWGSASIINNEHVFDGPARVRAFQNIKDSIANQNWYYAKVSYLTDVDSVDIPYIHFDKTDYRVTLLTMEQIDSVRAMLKTDSIQEAIAWFNEHLTDSLHLPLAKEVTSDTVRIIKQSEGPDAQGRYKCQYFAPSLSIYRAERIDTIGALDSVYSSFHLTMQEGVANVGTYTYRSVKYDTTYYTLDDHSAMEVRTDSVVNLKDWGICFNGSQLSTSQFGILYTPEGETQQKVLYISGYGFNSKDKIWVFDMGGLRYKK